MTNTKKALLYQALALLRKALEVPDHHDPKLHQIPIEEFVRNYLMLDADSSYSCEDLWCLYQEATGVGLAGSLKKAVFLKQLPSAMDRVFGVRKSTNVIRDGHRVRGFKNIGSRPISEPLTAAELDPPIEPEIVLPEPNLDPEPMTVPPAVTEVWSSAPRLF